MSLIVHQIKFRRKTFLTLEGTVLIVNEKNRYLKSELQVPIELLNIYENKKLRGKYIIIALLALFIPFISAGVSHSILFDTLNFNPIGIIGTIHSVTFITLLIFGFIIFLTFIVRFFLRRKTISFFISPSNTFIEFWKESKKSKEIDELLEKIEYRKTIVEESISQPSQRSIGFIDSRTMLPQLICSIMFLSLLAIVAQNIQLMYLALIPFAWFLYKKIIILKKVPKEFREATKLCFKEDWDKAIALLKTLREQYPEYLAVYTLLISIYTRTFRFDEAFEVVSEIPEEYIDLAQKIQSDVWRCKRLYQRRKESIPEQDNNK